MNTALMTAALALGAYLLGSISFAVVSSKLFGIADPRTYGSKNPGATNVLRSGNKKAAIATLVGDAAKGWLAVFLVVRYQEQLGVGDMAVALVSIAVFLGHLWPVFFRFVGGKGVATAAGVLLGLNVWLGVATLVTWLVVAYAFRYSSLAALAAAVFAPFYYGLLFGVEPQLFAVAAMSMLLLFRHSQNIANLMAGKESRIGGKSKDAAKTK
ncbi:glycerol-3-phosphate 1-O-acyltransferase PlsY [Pseudoduganella namucuonensis]|uniref:Glycerol-3-phosphate acyltransferase n=1 Tax=Pseudoduganella namucuonensis TaxID=1035707 RepID=A0A1I7FUW7_9BURK|nr:glycerol-3-phosphate 1-O-acyltransferase PlsY [Pseudoduganella namucuonensis]SFU39968.1 glycerol-3-phosphate acyltransferase PlsY [Pseudoduganella namucuonensis]